MHVYAYAYACTHTHTHSRWAKDEMRIARISAWLPDSDAVLLEYPHYTLLHTLYYIHVTSL
jgi:hypothetical protein